METSTKLTVIAAVFLVVVVTAIGIHMMSQDQDSDDGFTPNPPVSGDWNYTAYISANADKTTFYEGTLRITVEDNEMTRFQQNIVKTLASEMTDDELELALGEIGKHNTGSDWPGGTWWPPESAPDYIITHSYDYAMEFENLNDEDLITYIRQGTDCRLIVVGDTAQLPPVGHDDSPALDPQKMSVYGTAESVLLDDVVRQESASGILFNATLVRCMLEAGIVDIPLFDVSFPDVEAVEGGEILEKIQDAYDRYGMEETIVITRSNKRANRFNEAIRRHVLFAEEEIGSGDMLMIVKNNYYYTGKEQESGVDFIANGDTARLVRIRKFLELYGFRFARVQLSFPDYDDMELDCNILLDTLSSDSPSLTREQSSRLFYAVAEDYADIPSKAKRYKEVRENPYFNAMQVKFAYAVTCHKAQGGQWKCVFVDRMLFGDEPMSRDLLRWLYTAITRATEKLYFINFDDRFFDGK